MESDLPPLPPPLPPGGPAVPAMVDGDEFKAGFGESLKDALDLRSWQDALDLVGAFERLEQEVGDAVDQEDALHKQVRGQLLPRVGRDPGDHPAAGVYKATPAAIRRVQNNTLFAGRVEACQGTSVTHDTLPLTVTQIGVCLVSYLGSAGSYGHRLYRRDMRLRSGDPLAEAFELMHRRAARSEAEQPSRRDVLSELIQRGVKAYAERAFLARVATGPWLMGRGMPAPYELLTGSGSTELLHLGLDVMNELIGKKTFLYVPGGNRKPAGPHERILMTLGHALRPLEFVIFETTEQRTRWIVEEGHLRGWHRQRATDFVNEVSPRVLSGVFRTYRQAPPQIFYCHEDHAEQAALIAMADSLLQPHRSFPTLMDLADTLAGNLFGPEAFEATVQGAYARKGDPLRFLGERETRG